MRVIGRLDIKNNHVIKGIQLEGLRKVGEPVELALRYYAQGVDELVLMDAVASLYGRNNLFHIIEKACREVFVPITIGGGIRSLEDINDALKAGADKVAINTQGIRTPKLISDAVVDYGSQCIVGSIEAKQKGASWEAYIENGREETNLDAVHWAKQLEELGVGEIMITSIDHDGMKQGFDIDLIERINNAVNVPVVASGGLGAAGHLQDLAIRCEDLSGILAGSALHYNLMSVEMIRSELEKERKLL